MVQKIHPRGVIWVPSIPPQAGHLSEKRNDDLAVQYEDVHVLLQKRALIFFKQPIDLSSLDSVYTILLSITQSM